MVAAACRKQGLGVLALGRAMSGPTAAKHRIKRVWRFLRNESVELAVVHTALLRCAIPPRGPVVVLIDWTDLAAAARVVKPKVLYAYHLGNTDVEKIREEMKDTGIELRIAK